MHVRYLAFNPISSTDRKRQRSISPAPFLSVSTSISLAQAQYCSILNILSSSCISNFSVPVYNSCTTLTMQTNVNIRDVLNFYILVRFEALVHWARQQLGVSSHALRHHQACSYVPSRDMPLPRLEPVPCRLCNECRRHSRPK